jgi:hypothetical protein
MSFSKNLSPANDSGRPLSMTGRVLLSVVCLLAIGCNDAETPTSPSSTSTTTTPTVAEPSVTEEFAGTVQVGSARFYSFTVEANGTVNVTLTAMGGAGVPSSVWMGLGLGVPSGEDCTATTTVNGPSGSTPQITGTYAPSVYCVRIYDIGNLYTAAQFAVTIAHP